MAKDIPKITRFTSIKGREGFLSGRDLAKHFEEGQVYEIVNILDQLIIRKIGPSALPEKGELPCSLSCISEIVCSSIHLMTIDEMESINKVNQ